MLVRMGVGRIYSGGHWWSFLKVVVWGAKSGEIWFLPLKTMKMALFTKAFKSLPPFRHPCLCIGKSSCHTIINWSNFMSFNTIPNSEILFNFTRKMKCFTDQFQLCFCFCIGNTKQLYLHEQHN